MFRNFSQILFSISLLSLWSANCCAQIYEGGTGDGFSVSCDQQLDNSALSIYFGGNQNVSSMDCYTQSDNNALAIYSGGNSDGFDFLCYTQADNNAMAIYAGGASDGFDVLCYTQADNNAMAIYAGGISDGFSIDCYTQPNNAGFDIYAGGTGSGFKISCLGTLVQVPLPIELIYFDGTCDQNEVIIVWTTASEINNDFFTVERSENGNNWEKLKVVDGAGNSSSAITYKVYDEMILQQNEYYRLKQTDFDGNISYSKTINVQCSNNGSDILIYPNPTNGSFVVEGMEENTEFVIYNTVGEKIISQKTNTGKTEVRLENLSSGIYFIYFKTPSGYIVKKIILNSTY